MARVIKLIEDKAHVRGKGTEDDPIRGIYQLFTLAGDLVLEYDPHTKESFFEPPYLKKQLDNLIDSDNY